MRPGKAGQRESNDVSHEMVVRNYCAPQALQQINATEADARLSGILFEADAIQWSWLPRCAQMLSVMGNR